MKNPDSRQASSGSKQMSFLPESDFNPILPTPNTLPAPIRLCAKTCPHYQVRPMPTLSIAGNLNALESSEFGHKATFSDFAEVSQ